MNTTAPTTTQVTPQKHNPLREISGNPSAFHMPVKTLDDLKQALIAQMGEEKGAALYEQFMKSMLFMAFGTMHKDMQRSQKAAKQMRSACKH